ncbi:hypothetical protein Q5H92_24615 [Hymenobacter sp. M29]|uniref:Nucleoside phosphorylase domain-containing protein n=1 Tax=Hymenobacter mellowenesis TaxID=3063995 RepID=A0ABT9AI70_9BACT|nr:hypothetical protein [Hymenobacter sp. M29]MDO7849568.1 hypothetical protein [Hymenobacter sp. M29]
MNFRSISEEEFANYIDLLSIVLVTVTPIEKLCLHERIVPLPNLADILVVQKRFYTYYIGMLGKYAVCHVESKMGSSGAAASVMTVQQAIEFVEPAMIIMLGIAFGADETTQRIGDVLVSELVIQYENVKIKAGKIQCRGYRQMSSVLLFNRFTSPLNWQFSLTKNYNSKIIAGHLLSGEKLIDDDKFRNQLISKFSPVIGGEMEGVGVASVAHAYNKDWLVVKGICDYADGNKSVNKSKRQKIAAKAAVDLCHNIFSDEFTFRDLGVTPLSITSLNDNCQDIDQVVFANSTFNAYSTNKEAFYLNRESDYLFKNLLDYNANIWSFGDSGLGKTCMTFRNLLQSNKKMCVIDFSSADASDMLAIFEYMHGRLIEFAKCDKVANSSNLMKSMDAICETLNKYFSDCCVVLEEMPLDGERNEIFKHVFSLIVKMSNAFPDSNVNFAFTSIGNPREYASSMAEKMNEKIHFVELLEWTEREMQALLTLMLKSIGCQMSSSYQNILINKSDNNPRSLKRNLRDVILFTQISGQDFSESLVKYFKDKFGYVQQAA